MKLRKYSKLPIVKTDYFLIGAGIMSTTLAILLKNIYPNSSITISEKLSLGGLESSHALNNAGTGHAGYCELNYTPIDSDNKIDITKAIKVNNAFTRSTELWDYLIDKKLIKGDFKSQMPHYTFVSGQEDVNYLSLRYDAMKNDSRFSTIEFSADFDEISKWLPLITEGRDRSIPIAATKADIGTDIDFGKLTGYYIKLLKKMGVKINTHKEIVDLYKHNGKWYIIEKDKFTDSLTKIETGFVFIGSGGSSINLLEKSRIPEGRHYGGFPVSGEWLVCDNPDIVNKHNAKVYGKASVGSPPMSVPHLDTRLIDGQKCLLFGPYAGLTTKFLKFGSKYDFFKSINIYNIRTMISAGIRNIPLTKYLLGEILKSPDDKFKTLLEYYPNANKDDWKPLEAGKRVQIIKNVDGKGVIEFGTEIVSSSDGSLACLLGASPGASTAVKIMVDLLNQCFNLDDAAKSKIVEMIPSYDKP